jgi:hypothetical protein
MIAAQIARAKTRISRAGSSRSSSLPLARNISLSFYQNLWLGHAVPSHLRGASRSSRTLRRDAVGVSMLQRGLHADERRRCARSSRVVLIPRRWYHARDDASHHMGNGGQQARSTGENAKQPFQPLRGECRVFSAEPVVPAACIFFAGGPWVRPAPGIPRALCLERAGLSTTRAQERAARSRTVELKCSGSCEVSGRQIQSCHAACCCPPYAITITPPACSPRS